MIRPLRPGYNSGFTLESGRKMSDGAGDSPAVARDVLVVEDDREINELVGAYAQIAGFGYRSALNGTSALEEVRRRPPALIVLDLMLPDVDGFEVCRRVRAEAEAQGKPIPVIVILSALDGEKSKQQGRACGAVEYVTKPFDPDRLMDVISRHAAPQPSPA
ncbi:MAG TPA: response regulator [Tepidisphaeraceae bacterium]|nr:response regulator [Tepidisphaeraceae bacterium]